MKDYCFGELHFIANSALHSSASSAVKNSNASLKHDIVFLSEFISGKK